MRFVVWSLLLCAFVPLCLSTVHAVPPAPGVAWPKNCSCYVNVKAAQERNKVYRAALASGRFAPPTITSPKILVIRVGFSDRPLSTSLATAQAFFNKVKSYYVENSYGTFTPLFEVSTQTYTLSHPMSYYGRGTPSSTTAYGNLFSDATSAAGADRSFTSFDEIMIYHAGNGQESGGSSDDIWSVFVPGYFTAGTKGFNGFTVVPETEAGGIDPLGVICHEYGHQLGLPDLYNTSMSGGQSTIGAWSIMDYPYTGSPKGSQPSHLDAWSKQFLGFLSPAALSGSLSLAPVEISQAGNRVAVPGKAQEYFLLEYRLTSSTATYDKSLPASGMLIWHIDDAIASSALRLANNDINSGNPHGVSLVRADNTEGVNSLYGNADGGDPFQNGDTFSSPQSNSFASQITGIAVASIAGVGGNSIMFTVDNIQAASSQAIVKAINYPNPAGKGYFHPKGEGWTTFVVQLGRPAGDINLNIYNLTGELVRSVPGSDLQLKIGTGEPTVDFKWVYEYDWNARNDDGKDVSPGVYIYRFKADGNVKTGKAMIVR